MRYILSLLLILGLAACQADSVTGPEGPAGPQGPQGQQGPQGPPGNANVHSQSAEFSMVVPPNQAHYVAMEVPALTSSVLEGGAAYAYVRFTGDPNWFALPFSILGDGAFFHQVVFRPGTAEMQVQRSGGGANVTLAGTFRVVAVAGSGQNRSAFSEPPPYEELAALYGLPLD